MPHPSEHQGHGWELATFKAPEPQVPSQVPSQQVGPAGRAGGGCAPGGGPAGQDPLVRAVRAKQPDMRKVAHSWLDRFAQDRHAAIAELVSFILAVADISGPVVIEREDVQEREPIDVVQELVAAIALRASETGADFTQYWLVSREKGAARVRDNFPAFWRELIASSPCQALLGGLFQIVRGWVQALSECQFRSIRHTSSVAALEMVEGLGVHCGALHEFATTAAMQIKDAEAQRAAARLASLEAEKEHVGKCLRDCSSFRDTFGTALLSRRTKDLDPEVRRSCFEALCRWAKSDPRTFREQLWIKYMHFGLCDREPRARVAVLGALQELLQGDPSTSSAEMQQVVEQLRPRVVARCHDVDPSVGAAAVRCAVLLATRGLLAEEDFEPVIDLVWDPDASRRAEAATFVSRHVFSEDILDYAHADISGALLPAGGGRSAVARKRLLMLLQFVAEYAEGHFKLVDRLVSAYWRRASCLEDWETFVAMALPGSEHTLVEDAHTALIHLMEAVARAATDDLDGTALGNGAAGAGHSTVAAPGQTAAAAAPRSDGVLAHARAVMDRAARALAPWLSALLEACQGEPVCMRRATSLCRLILRHCAQAGSVSGSDGLVAWQSGGSLAESLRNAFLRQPDPEALENIAEAMAHLIDLATPARPLIHELAGTLRARFLDLVPKLNDAAAVGPSQGGTQSSQDADSGKVCEAMLAVAVRLRILCKAFDVSMCDLRNFGAALLGLLDDRVAAVGDKRQPAVNAQLAVVLLELLVLVLTRHSAAHLQPSPLLACVIHDPINQQELQLVPTAVDDMFNVASALLLEDPSPHLRTAALGAVLAMLTAWWNASRYAASVKASTAGAEEGGEVPQQWVLCLKEDVAHGLWTHLGQLLIEANAVPKDAGHLDGCFPQPGNPRQPSCFSQLFATLNRTLVSHAVAGVGDATNTMTDTEKVRIAVLGSSMVATCRHPDVIEGLLPALVLSQGLSPREDLQEAAWTFLRRLRKEAHVDMDNVHAFFLALLRAVQTVHQEAGTEVARDLSFRLLSHVGVGKLVPNMQAGLLAAVRQGVEATLNGEANPGFLEALVPWITKNVVDDASIRDLAIWAAERGAEHAKPELEASLNFLIQACQDVIARGAGSRQQQLQKQQLNADAPSAALMPVSESVAAPFGGRRQGGGRAAKRRRRGGHP